MLTMNAFLTTLVLLASLTRQGLSFNVARRPPTFSAQGRLFQSIRPGHVSRTSTLLLQRGTRSQAPMALYSAAISTGIEKNAKREIDFSAIAKYGVALVTQVGLFAILFSGLDKLIVNTGFKVPFVANFIFFSFTALMSSVLSPLPSKRPKSSDRETKESPEAKDRITPTWTPPGFVFPIMWLLVVAPLRSLAASMVYRTLGTYANAAILSLMLHLSIGDIWTTINNVERRNGVAVVAVAGIWLSKVYATYRFFQVNQLAGKLLGLTLGWLTIAAALVTRIWQLNPDPETGKPESLYPAKGKAKTRFLWSNKQ